MADVIAELATNHGGDLDLAARMIAEAKKCGADYAKVQAYQTKFLRPGDPQEAWFKQAELSEEGLRFLKRVCDDEGIKFLATVFDPERVPLIRELSDTVKIGAATVRDVATRDACESVRPRFDRLFLSTGIDTNLWWWFNFGIVPLACVTAYPADADACRVAIAAAAIAASNDEGDADLWGYSDHSVGLDCCQFAHALGASVYEVHVALAGTGRRLACDKLPRELADLVLLTKSESQFRYIVSVAKERAAETYSTRWAHGR